MRPNIISTSLEFGFHDQYKIIKLFLESQKSGILFISVENIFYLKHLVVDYKEYLFTPNKNNKSFIKLGGCDRIA